MILSFSGHSSIQLPLRPNHQVQAAHLCGIKQEGYRLRQQLPTLILLVLCAQQFPGTTELEKSPEGCQFFVRIVSVSECEFGTQLCITIRLSIMEIPP